MSESHSNRSHIDPSVGIRLKQIRQSRGVSQAKFYTRLGLTQSAGAGYERGARRPRLKVLAQLARQEGVDLNWLLAGTGDGPLTEEPAETITRQQKLEALAADVQAQLDNVLGWISSGKMEAAETKAYALERHVRILKLALAEEARKEEADAEAY